MIPQATGGRVRALWAHALIATMVGLGLGGCSDRVAPGHMTTRPVGDHDRGPTRATHPNAAPADSPPSEADADADAGNSDPAAARFDAPVLRWKLGETDARGYAEVQGLELLEVDGAVRWSWSITPVAAERVGKLQSRRNGGRDPRKTWLVEWGPDAVVVADALGARRLALADGRVLASWSSPPSEEGVWFEDGTFEVSGAWSCAGDARRGAFAARCDDRLLYFDGRVMTLLDANTLQPLESSSIDQRDAKVEYDGAKTRVVLRLGRSEVKLEGVVYMQ